MVNVDLLAIIIAIVQGITEWLPISSSGHLVLASQLLGFENTLSFDLALHFGTLVAVFVYFGKDIIDILRDLLSLRFHTENGKLGVYLIIASIPAAIFGFAFESFFETSVNNLTLLALGFAISGIFLIIASTDFILRKGKDLNWKVALGIGIFQVASLFRGISRSGSTIGGGVLLGLDQRKAARFSFLMAIPIIFGASLVGIGNATIPVSYIIPAFISFIVGLGTIHVLLKFVLTSKKNLRWFGLYALLLALVLGMFLILG